MFTTSVNFFGFISEREGFHFNTDIFETNVLNLSVVIAVLIYYGRIVLSDLMNSRKLAILKSLKEAEGKFEEAEKSLSLARKNLLVAESKAAEIRAQAVIVSNQTAKNLLDTVDEDIKRLKAVNFSFIHFEEEKMISEVCRNLNTSAFTIALDKLNKRLNVNIQKRIISQCINKLNFKMNLRK